jgi:hypothetical protein
LGTCVLCFDKASEPEAIANWVPGEKSWQAFVDARYKGDWDCNEGAVVIKLAVPYTIGVVLLRYKKHT